MKKDIQAILLTFLVFVIMSFGGYIYNTESVLKTALQPLVSIFQASHWLFAFEDYNAEIRWSKKEHGYSGIQYSRYNSDNPGYIIYVTTHDTKARLINTKGENVYEWDLNIHEAFPKMDHIPSVGKLTQKHFSLRDVELLDDGSVIVAVNVYSVTPWGAGLVKLDKNSQIVWTLSKQVGNDFYINPKNNNIYVITQAVQTDPLGIEANSDQQYGIRLPYISEFITILDKNGQEIDTISLMEAFIESPYSSILRTLDLKDDDYFHMNSIDVVKRDHSSLDWLKEGYIIVSLRDISTMAIIDPETKKVVHAEVLPADHQHYVDYLEEEETLLLFDNRGHTGPSGYSRIIEIDPMNMSISWSFHQELDERPFETRYWGFQQKLQNGNLLTSDPDDGHIFEITKDKEIVFSYYTPLRNEERDLVVPTITNAKKIEDKSKLDFIKD